jgi:methyltransferase (TIGR00027 family)
VITSLRLKNPDRDVFEVATAKSVGSRRVPARFAHADLCYKTPVRPGHASITATIVSLARHVATHDPALGPICRDPVAPRLLPAVLRDLAGGAERAPRWLFSGLRRASLGLVDHIALRTAAIDAALELAVERGARQIVILGAGFDARALRLASLRECDVFEVDHPDTQARKRRAAEGLVTRARRLHYVACDLREADLGSALLSAAFDATRRSVWIWEGVTMYLQPSAVAATLDRVAALCPVESVLISTYAHPQLSIANTLSGRIGAFGLAALSEPIRFSSTAQAYAALLAAHGFSVLSDRGTPQVAAELGISLPRWHFGMPYERIAVARRVG